MNKNKKTKEFDCLEYKYRVQENIYSEIKNFNFEEEKEYFNRKAKSGSFGYLFEQLQSKTSIK
jgi:hypothetical protein